MRVRVPASIANLGSGFDVLAMAVDLWLEVIAEPADAPEWEFLGEGADFLSCNRNPLSVLPMRGQVRNGIPMGVGLGSSAAARLAASALGGLDRDRCFEVAASQEGHPDNVAAAAYGGIRLVAPSPLALPRPEVEIALLVAHRPALTEAARRVLPAQVPLADAIFNAGRLALLIHALHSGQLELLADALKDRLHQPYRCPLYPWTAEVLEAARVAGDYGTAISGAGPSVFAFCPPGEGQRVAAAMAAAAPSEGYSLVSRIANSGMIIEA
ncbi:MAG: homoserine kinase [Candidatus Dormibacteraceae bacterium]